MNYQRFLAELPADMQEPMARLLEAFQEEMRNQLAVSQEPGRGLQSLIADLEMAVAKLIESHHTLTQTVAWLAENRLSLTQTLAQLIESEQSLTQSVTGLVENERGLTQTVGLVVENIRGLQQAITQLSGNQYSLEQTITRLTESLGSLTQSVARLTASEQGLIQTVVRLAEEQRNLAHAVKEVVAAQRRTDELLQKLTLRLERMETKLRTLIDEHLERKYRERALSYLGTILRPVQVVSLQEILPQLEAHLSEEEIERLLPLALLLRGQVRHLEPKPEVWLAMEVAGVIEDSDVTRAIERARLLTKAGLPTIPTVGGGDLAEGVARLASQERVFVLLEGQRLNWQEALERVLKSA
jgi:chromosome segregation ATPase